MTNVFIEAEEDRRLAADIKMLSGKYKDFGPKQAAVLQFAIDHRITDLEAAYHAMRGLAGAASGTRKSVTRRR